MTTTKEALEPCPFCGGSAGDVPLSRGHGFIIGCNTCQAQQFAMSREEAVRAWNSRVSAPIVAPEVDEQCTWTWNRDTEYEGFWIAECKQDEDWPIKTLQDGARFCTFCGRSLLVKGEE